MSRQAKTQPRIAYDYRRAILLVQVLAMDTDYYTQRDALRQLARGWRLREDGGHARMVRRLAQHALKHARKS